MAVVPYIPKDCFEETKHYSFNTMRYGSISFKDFHIIENERFRLWVGSNVDSYEIIKQWFEEVNSGSIQQYYKQDIEFQGYKFYNCFPVIIRGLQIDFQYDKCEDINPDDKNRNYVIMKDHIKVIQNSKIKEIEDIYYKNKKYFEMPLLKKIFNALSIVFLDLIGINKRKVQ